MIREQFVKISRNIALAYLGQFLTNIATQETAPDIVGPQILGAMTNLIQV